jgi:hypothetical protein
MNDVVGLERINIERGFGKVSRDNTSANGIRKLTGDVFRNPFGDKFRLVELFLASLDDTNFRRSGGSRNFSFCYSISGWFLSLGTNGPGSIAFLLSATK